jgi:hypothetical protein
MLDELSDVRHQVSGRTANNWASARIASYSSRVRLMRTTQPAVATFADEVERLRGEAERGGSVLDTLVHIPEDGLVHADASRPVHPLPREPQGYSYSSSSSPVSH